MPGKTTRRQRAKSSGTRRKRAARQNTPVAAAGPVVVETDEPESTSAPHKTTPVPKPESSAVRHPYITSELWTIGILATVMLAILIVLALVFT